jgi:hypothetical protein
LAARVEDTAFYRSRRSRVSLLEHKPELAWDDANAPLVKRHALGRIAAA